AGHLSLATCRWPLVAGHLSLATCQIIRQADLSDNQIGKLV
ncbi:MAG: hypothetical protein ACI9VR_002103, partial [Cognaticolwellia sp.]